VTAERVYSFALKKVGNPIPLVNNYFEIEEEIMAASLGKE